ncbi:MAG TPA: MFS transporter [Streptosporangiaceae bacterium]|nr:MFS transporter [Streptosporangiaceae bacterium]
MAASADGIRAPFFRYWLSAFLAVFGDGVRLAAFPLLAAQLTRSPAAVAAVTAVQGLPWLLIGAGAGVVVDRSDSRRLMLIVDTARAAIIAALAVAVLVNSVSLPLIYVTAFVTGCGSALRDTAAVTCVPRLVRTGDLEQANGRLIAGQIVGNELAGPAAGGWMFGIAAALPFGVNAGTLGLAALLLLTLPSVFRPLDPAGRTGPPPTSLRRDLRDGLAWLWNHSDIRDVTIAAGVVSAMDASWFAVLVLYVVQILHCKPGAYGLLLAVGALGGIATGGLGARITRRLGPWSSLLLAGFAMAVTQAGLGLGDSVVIAAALLFVSSGAFALFNMTAVTMRQRQVPPELLGRITSLYGVVTRGCEALGAMVGGALAAAAGIRAPMLAGAAPLFAAMVLLTWRHRGRPASI